MPYSTTHQSNWHERQGDYTRRYCSRECAALALSKRLRKYESEREKQREKKRRHRARLYASGRTATGAVRS